MIRYHRKQAGSREHGSLQPLPNGMVWRRALFAEEELLWLRRTLNERRLHANLSERQSRKDLLKWEPSPDGTMVPLIRVKLGDEYDRQASRNLARRRKQPTLAPHGSFRALTHGDNFQAVEFLSKFGPLVIEDFDGKSEDERFWLNLQEFWTEHARFVAAACLWETRDHSELLRSAWRRVHELVGEIDPNSDVPFGSMARVDWHLVGSRARNDELVYNEEPVYATELPWRRPIAAFETWLEGSSDQELRNWAITVTSRELDLNGTARTPRWRYEGAAGHDRFILSLGRGTLWNSIWESFAEDTSDRGGWRVCPHCDKVFYPLRRDRMYCTVRLQQLASKREYARRSRAEAKTKS